MFQHSFRRCTGFLRILLAALVLHTTYAVSFAQSDSKSPLRIESTSKELSICSFNIQFLGNFKTRDNEGLAALVSPFDMVVVQELVAPPYEGRFPDGTPFKPDAESARFFEAMKKQGFTYVLSEEDTGAGDTIHLNSAATEWWVVFYREERVQPAEDLPHGFLAAKRGNNPDFDRVPCAFGFRTTDKGCDFVLIPVHLNPDHAERRKHELQSIGSWVRQHNQHEKDFIILGDMNIQSSAELKADTPENFISLNDNCVATNTNPKSPEPYDHVMFNPEFTREIDRDYGFKVIDLAKRMKEFWHSSLPYPGDPYVHDRFRTVYSDHIRCILELSSLRWTMTRERRKSCNGESQ